MTAPPVVVPGGARRWVQGARPRTLAAAASPVVVGTALGWWLRSAGGAGPGTVVGGVIWWRAGCALIVALAFQVGVNFANDYSDGVRGTDKDRIGPLRLVASGAAHPRAVAGAALGSFFLACVAGLALAAATTWWLVPVGACCAVAGWLYTGGPKPYGYLGLGEAFVFVFFGVVATLGSAYVQVGGWIGAWWACVPVGLLASALLEANNLRDLDGDLASGKRTLAVRLGDRRARLLYLGLLVASGCGVVAVGFVRPWALLALLAGLLALRPARAVMGGATGEELLAVLGRTGLVQLAAALLLALGIVL